MSFLYPVPTFEQDVSYGLGSVAALAFVGINFVDGVQVCAQADLACTYLRDDRTDGLVGTRVDLKLVLSWLNPELIELSAVFGILPGHVPLVFHPLADVGFGSCYKGLQGGWL